VVTIVPGFTGKYIAEYLNSHPERSGPTPFTFAIAGRSQKKLEDVRRELKLGPEVGLLVVDVGDYASVEAAVTQTKVVVNTVGPYWRYADNVVRYVDFPMTPHAGAYIPTELVRPMETTTSTLLENPISSRPQSKSPSIHSIFPLSLLNLLSKKRYDYQAYKNNAILIPCCGFDSVPADVVVYLANKTAKSVLGPSACIEDSISLYKLKGGFSGGTLASVISSIEDVPKGLTAEAMKEYSYREREGVPPHPSRRTRSLILLQQRGPPPRT